jgi:N-acetylmuramoyl-L-alanine amidase
MCYIRHQNLLKQKREKISPMRVTRRIRLRGLAFLAMGISVFVVTSSLAAQLSVTLPNRSITLPVFVVEHQSYVDARAVATLVSGELQVNAPQGSASIRIGSLALTLQDGTSTVRVAERAVSLSSPPRLLGRRFLVPLDLVPVVLAERFGEAVVEWKPEKRVVRVRSRDATITQIRVGAYPTYTRIVFETVGPQEWSIRNDENSGALHIMLPGGVLAKNIQPLTLRAGIVRAIQPAQQAGGVEVTLLRESRDGKIRDFTLKDPDRIVIDVLVGQPEAPDQRTAPSKGPSSPTARPMEAALTSPTKEATAKESQPSTVEPALPLPTEAGNYATDRQQVTTPIPPSANVPSGSLGGSGILTVVLDPGHGGHDTGAIGPSGLMEKDVVLDLAFRLRRLLTERLGIRVIMTRTEDVFVPLQERTAIANRAKADFFLSLHVNAALKRGAGGFETFYFTREPSDSDARASAQRENLVIESNGTGADLESLLKITLADMAVTRDMRESGELAEFVLTSLDKLLKVENRGIKSGPFYVLATAAMPAILVESAFITNPIEERRLTQGAYRQRVAEALYSGIAKYKVRYERRLGMGVSAAAAAGS